MTGEQVGMLREALVDAFPRRSALAQFVRVRLEQNLDAIAGDGLGLGDAVFELVVWAESHGHVELLVEGALRENPGNPRLQGFVISMGHVVGEGGRIIRDTLSVLYEQGAPDDVIAQAREERRSTAGYELQPSEHLGADGRYRLLRKVGRGGFASVWEAYDIRLRSRVAVKVLHADFGSDPMRIDRFKRGALKMQRLDHPGVVQILREHETWKGVHYFVMRYFEEGDLKQAVLQRRIGVEEGLRIVREIGDVLAFAHEHESRLVHRDVKPDNILLTMGQGGRLEARLTDFDLARAEDSQANTTAGMAMGAFLFAAPEAMRDGASADERSDVFSLGCTALFVALGREFSVPEWVSPARALAAVVCAEAVKQSIARAMEQDPSRRFATMRDFVGALRGEARRESASGPQQAGRAALVGREPTALRGTVRVYEIAEDLRMNTADVLHKLTSLGIPAKNKMTKVDARFLDPIRNALLKDRQLEFIEIEVAPGVKKLKRIKPP